jgi:hypothetical protein
VNRTAGDPDVSAEDQSIQLDLRSTARLHEIEGQIGSIEFGRRMVRYVLLPAAALLLLFVVRTAGVDGFSLERVLGLSLAAAASGLSMAQSARTARARLGRLREERMALADPAAAHDAHTAPPPGRLFGRR